MEGLRVLAFTFREIPEEHLLTAEDEDHLVFLGMIAMMDPPREESKAAVEECIKAGIRPVMITGDHKITAAAIAKRIGILKDLSEACEGAEIENMSDEELRGFVPKISVYARVSPEHKIRIVRAWQERLSFSPKSCLHSGGIAKIPRPSAINILFATSCAVRLFPSLKSWERQR